MSQFELMESIVASPDDDVPRRIWADVALEAGDLRGELVHIQCDLALGGLTRDDAIRRRRGELALLAAHDGTWSRELATLARAWKYRRGFVDEVVVDARVFANRAAELFELAPMVRNVVLDGLVCETGEDRARIIERAHAALAVAQIDRVVGLGYRLDDPFTEGRAGALVEASIALLAERAPRFKRLTRLAIRGGRMTALGARALAGSVVLGKIEHLELEGHHLTPACVQAVLDSPHLADLRGLALGHNDLSGHLARLLGHPHLAELDELAIAGSTRLGNELVEVVALPHLHALRRLEIGAASEVRTPEIALRAIADSPMLANLETLHLVNVEPRQLPALADPARLDHLRVLRIVDSPFLDAESFLAILEWPLARRLAVIDVRWNEAATSVASQLRERFDGVMLVSDPGAPPEVATLDRWW